MAKSNGLAPLPSGLLRPTTPQPDDDRAEDVEPAAEGRGDAPAESRPARARKPRTKVPSGETKGRKLNLSDDTFDRLQLAAIKRRTTISAVAEDLLSRNLPKLRIEQD
jgi:hypothetical protein